MHCNTVNCKYLKYYVFTAKKGSFSCDISLIPHPQARWQNGLRYGLQSILSEP